MESPEITCPYCWQNISIEEPPKTDGAVEFITDCEVCCRPIRVTATWDDESGPFLEVEPES
jgi:hypothetical protein